VAENIEFRSHTHPIGHLEGVRMARPDSGPFGEHGKARPALARLRPLWQGSTRLVGPFRPILVIRGHAAVAQW
jgi:hypothetical protein